MQERYGWREAVTDWREQVSDPRDRALRQRRSRTVHAEPTIEAVRAGKHVLCEKPLGMDAAESHEMWAEAERAGVQHMCGFNYRFVPAVRPRTGDPRGRAARRCRPFPRPYLQSWGWEADENVWRFDPAQAGTGAIGDLGTHIIDLARYLVGDIAAVSALVRTVVPGRDVDDHFVATIEFENGVIGTLEASRLARGRINYERVRDERVARVDRLRCRAVERAPGRRREGLYPRARDRAGAPVHAVLVAARPHRRLGRHVHARASPTSSRRSPASERSRRTAPPSRTATVVPR